MNAVERILKMFRKKPYLIRMGTEKISKMYNVSSTDVMEARKLIHKEKKEKKGARILVFDIETSPLKVYVWRRWMQNVYLD